MNGPPETRRTSSRWIGAAVTLGIVVLFGIFCARQRDGVTTTDSELAACSITRDSLRRMTRSGFRAWAGRLQYHDPDTSRGAAYDRGIQVSAVQGINEVNRATLAAGCVIARIVNTTGDTTIVRRGTWYVWADSTNPLTATAISESGPTDLQYQMAIVPESEKNAVVFSPRHVCSECSGDWCVYPRDGTLTETDIFAPAGTGGGG